MTSLKTTHSIRFIRIREAKQKPLIEIDDIENTVNN